MAVAGIMESFKPPVKNICYFINDHGILLLLNLKHFTDLDSTKS